MLDVLLGINAPIIAYLIGNSFEKNHYKSIMAREVRFFRNPCITFSKNVINEKNIIKTELVATSVVLSCDYFKYFISSLKTIFGGNLSAYESVLDRARREAILRVKEQSFGHGADALVNIKVETVILDSMNEQKNNAVLPKVCVTVYGTAITYGK